MRAFLEFRMKAKRLDDRVLGKVLRFRRIARQPQSDGIEHVQMLENLPMTKVVSGFAVILLLIFFITSSDSGSLVVDTITAGGKLHAPVAQRIFWATMEGAVAAILLFGGGDKVLSALQAGAITTALP